MVRYLGAILALSLLATFLGPTEARAATFGLPIMTNVDTQSQTTQVVIPLESLEAGSTFGSNVVYSLFSDSDSRSLSLICSTGSESVVCSTPTNSLVTYLNPIANWGLGETYDLAILGKVSGNTEYRWPAMFTKIDLSVPKTLEYTDSTSGAYLIGVDQEQISVSARILNRSGAELSGEIYLVLDGEPIASGYTSGSRITLTYSSELLSEGLNNLEIRSASEFGELANSFTIEKYSPQVSDISIQVPGTFYPVRDNFEDTLAVDLAINTPSGREIPGVGSVTITNSARTKVASWALIASGAHSFTFSGLYKNKPVSGVLTVTVTFTANGGNKVSNVFKITASTKKLVDVSKTITVPAWQALISCQPFDYSCNHWLSTTSSSGVELYNESFDRSHRSVFNIDIPEAAYKWKVSLNTFTSGLRSAAYQLESTDENYTEGTGAYLGITSSKPKWKGTFTSGWAETINPGNASWAMTSSNWGSVFFKSVTVTYVYKTLK